MGQSGDVERGAGDVGRHVLADVGEHVHDRYGPGQLPSQRLAALRGDQQHPRRAQCRHLPGERRARGTGSEHDPAGHHVPGEVVHQPARFVFGW
jgi:hypothetical protein